MEGCLYPQLSEERADAGSRAPRHRGGPGGGGTGHGPGTRSVFVRNISVFCDPDRHPRPAAPDPDPYPCQPNMKIGTVLFSREVQYTAKQYTVQNTENHDTIDTDTVTDRAIKTGIAANKSQFFEICQHV